MKKYLIAFIVLIAFGSLWFYIKSRVDHPTTEKLATTGFVQLKDGKFNLDGKAFYPVAVNYVVVLQSDGKSIWPSAYSGYGPGSKFRFTQKDQCLKELKDHMQLIHDMGFNTVRIVGIGEPKVMDKLTGRISVGVCYHGGGLTDTDLTDSTIYASYLKAIDQVIEAVHAADLKAILTTRVFHDVENTEVNLKILLRHFHSEKTIMAYDLFNEPLYFDSLQRNKQDIYYFTKKWHEIVRKYAPNQLCTIGLSGIREVFEWDPNLVEMDFLSFHPYEYEPEQVRNEMYWYNKFVRKPWIIGETSFEADNDSVTYQQQRLFVQKTLEQIVNCGGIGYSWWQFKEVEWGTFHENYMGIVNHTGITITSKGDTVLGTPKPMIEDIKAFHPDVAKGQCQCMSNFYNYSSNTNFKVTGRLLTEDKKPVIGGQVLGWNEWWISSYNTATKPDGTFDLYSSFPIYHWMASGTLYSMVRGDMNPLLAKKGTDGIPTIDLGTLVLKRLKNAYD